MILLTWSKQDKGHSKNKLLMVGIVTTDMHKCHGEFKPLVDELFKMLVSRYV